MKDAAGSAQRACGVRASEHLAEWLVVGCVHSVLFCLESGWWEAEWLYPAARGTSANGLVSRDRAQSALWKTPSSPGQGEVAAGAGKL